MQQHFGQKKPCPRRVAQEGFMATPVGHLEQTDISGNPRFRWPQHKVDPTSNAMSSPSRSFRRVGGHLTMRAEPASGSARTNGPSGRLFVELKLVPIARREV